jgi:hypothetical protein
VAGKVVSITIGWTVDTDDGPSTSVISLGELERHCRRERVDDLVDDLVVLCEDVQDAREAPGRRALRMLRGSK